MKYFFSLFCVVIMTNAHAVNLNAELNKAMKAFQVPVVGYAIIDDGRLVAAKTISIDPRFKVDVNSLFQAASISKSLTAYAALKLVDEKKLHLNGHVNQYLTNWKIPENHPYLIHPVEIRHLMDMTSGLSVASFAGYEQGQTLPTYLDILNGKPPANSKPIRVTTVSGETYAYSGGAFQVLQQVISDVTKQDFNTYMNDEVLSVLGMNHSVFEYPLKKFKKKAVPGFDKSGNMIKGGWRNYMCAGACGMWSTPTDLATFALNVSSSAIKGKGFLSKTLAQQMLTRQSNTDYGLGVVVSGSGDDLYFWKAGHHLGYHSLMIMFPYKGKGLVVMTNAEAGSTIINYLVALIAQKYKWPAYTPFFDELIKIPTF